MPSDTFFPSSGGYYALQRDASRRLGLMEQRARNAIGRNGQDNTEHDTPAGQDPVRREKEETVRQDEQDRANPPAENRTPPARSAASKAVLPPDGGSDLLERLFLLALIYLLSREKRDPCLIAALVYLVL